MTHKHFFLLLLALPCLFGCGERLPFDVIVVTGTVTVDGQPMEGISITFIPLGDNGLAAFDVTDAQGRFRLSSPQAPVGSGAVPGEYAPTFSKMEVEEHPPTASPEEAQRLYGNAPPKITHLIPERYGNAKTSGIEPVKVEKGKKNAFSFDLSTK